MSRNHRGQENEIRGIERRTAPRYAILQRCFVHPTNDSGPQAWRSIAFDVSAAGVGVTLPVKLALGTLLTIHAWGVPDAPPLKVRVVSTRAVDTLWFTGCELLKRLPNTALRAWRSGPTDWLED